MYIHNVFYIYRENKRDKKVVHGIEGEGEREREREFVGADRHLSVRGRGRAPEGSWERTGTGGFVGTCRVCKGERGREGEESFAGRL